MKIKSSISTLLKKRSVFRGSLIGGMGVVLLLITGTSLPLSQLKQVGLPIFCVGFALILIGLYPYRRLTRLELSPYELEENAQAFILSQRGKRVFAIDKKGIEAIEYLEDEKVYGFGIKMKRPVEKSIQIYGKKGHFAEICTRYLSRFKGYDLFLPYFSKRSFQRMHEK